MEVQIILNHKDKMYKSDPIKGDDVKEAKELVRLAANDQLDHFSFVRGENEYYFGKEILKESIIVIKTTK